MKNNFLLASLCFFSPRPSESAGFDNYDDEDDFDPELETSGYDPDNLDSSATAKPRRVMLQKQTATFDLVMTNTSAIPRTIELFNYLRSFTKKRRADYTGGANGFNYQPLSSLEGSQRAGVGIVGFNQEGDLVLTGTSAVAGVAPAAFVFGADGGVKVVCSQFPYISLLQSSALVPFRITKIRLTTVNDEQIDQPIVWFSNSFLGGNKENTINPRSYFRPEQFQSKIVDVPLNLVIDGEKGIRYIVNNGETTKWNVTIAQYRKVTVR